MKMHNPAHPGELLRAWIDGNTCHDKRDYHGLADAVPIDQISTEVRQKLDDLVVVANRANSQS